MTWLAAALSALALAAPPGDGAAWSPGSRVLVLPFAVDAAPGAPGGAGASFWLGEAAALLLAEELSAHGLGLLSRDQRIGAYDALQLPQLTALSRATMFRVGEVVGATELVMGELRIGEALQVRARLVRIGTAGQLADVTESGPPGDLFATMTRLAARLAPAAGRPITGPAPVPARPAIETYENYVKGLVAVTPAAQQRFLETALKQAPREPRVLLALWGVYAAQGLHDRALAAANAVPADSPFARRARFAAALSLVDLGRLDGAFKELGALDAERPSPVVANAAGVVALRRRDGAAAADWFTRAVDRDPAQTDYLFNLGYAHAQRGDLAASLHWLREAVRRDAASGDAHHVMAAVLAAAGRTAEAQRELELARLLVTRQEPATLSAAAVPAGLERLPVDLDAVPGPGAAAAIDAAGQRGQQQTAAYHLDRGRRLFEAGNDREAAVELGRAIYLAPYDDAPHLLLGRLYLRGGRLAQAVDEFKVALWARETVEARLALGAALAEAGDLDAARREAERALALDPGSAEARELLRRIGGGSAC